MFLTTANNIAFAIVTPCIMYLMTLSETVDATSVVNFTAFTRQTDFNQSECPEGDKVFSKDVKWLTQCLRLCANEKSCRTVLYDETKCNGCTDTYTILQETLVSDRITHFQKSPECEDGWYMWNVSCYFITDEGDVLEGYNWCYLNLSHIVSVGTEEENNALKLYARTRYPDTHSFFIGISDCQVDGVWKDNTSGNYATFLDFETRPANGNISTCCVVYSKLISYKWAGFACTDKNPRTICERPAN